MRRINKLLKSSTSLMLVFAMLMGLCATAFAAGETESNELNYVSLGDSMANGYGLDGYEDEDGNNVNGFLREVADAYPALFADEIDAELTQLAISAMRAEDLHFILEFPYDNAEALEVAEMDEWDKAAWNAMFTTGDFYTWDEFTTRRFQDYGKKYGDWSKSGTDNVAEIFQTSVANADIVSLGIGNANFGVFALGRVTNALGVLGGDASEDSWLEFERALAECDEETYTFIMEMYDELHAMLDEEVSASPKGDAIVNALMYTAVSYVLNYAGVIDRIVELNDDATIMIVGLMNTMNGMKVTVEGETYNIGRYLNWMIMAMNTYLSGLPAAMQIAGKYENATFLYAEASNVDMIYMDMADEFNDTLRRRIIAEMNEMIFTSELGANLDLGGMTLCKITFEDVANFEKGIYKDETMATCMVYLAFEKAILEACDLKTLDVDALLALTGDLGAAFGDLDLTFMEEIEKTINEILDLLDGELSLEMLAKLKTDYPEIYDAFFARYDEWLVNYNYDNYDEIEDPNNLIDDVYAQKKAEVLDGYLLALNMVIDEYNATMEEALAGTPIEFVPVKNLETLKDADAVWTSMTAVVDDPETEDVNEVEEAAKACFVIELTESVGAALAESTFGTAWVIEGAEIDLKRLYELSFMLDQNKTLLPLMFNEDCQNDVMDIATLAITDWTAEKTIDGLSESLNDNLLIKSLLHLFARMLIGDGIGCHPNKTGHEEIFEAVKTSYENEFTALDATVEKAMKVLNKVAYLVEEYHDEAYAYGFAYAKEEGYIDTAITVLEKLDAKFEALQIRVQKTSHPITDEFRYEVVTEIETVQESIAQAIVLLNTPELDWNEYAEMMALVEENIDRCLNILDVAIDDLSEGVYEEDILPLIQELNDMVIELNEYVENEVLPAIDNAIREAYNAAMDYLYDLVDTVYTELVDVLTELVTEIDENLADLVANIDEEIRNILEKNFNTVVELIEEYGPDAIDMIIDMLIEDLKELGEDVKDEIEESIDRATHGTYATSLNSYYVAVGDSSAVAGGYTDLLATQLGLAGRYTNLAAPSQTVEESIAALIENAETVAGADLITIGYSNNTFFEYMVAQLKAYMGGLTNEMDWSDYIGNTFETYVNEGLDAVRAELIAQGIDKIEVMGESADDLIMLAVESYAYAYAQYAFNYPEMVQTIRDINPDALIVSVGMSNTLADIELDLTKYAGTEMVVDLGEYIQYIINVANGEALLNAMIVEGVVYVDAPDVEIEAAEDKYDDIDTFLKTAVFGSFSDLYATAAGHEYIKEQILNALDIVLVGDVNLDGVVDIFDAVELLDIIAAGTADELAAEKFAAADVDGNGSVEIFDAIELVDMIAAGTDSEQ